MARKHTYFIAIPSVTIIDATENTVLNPHEGVYDTSHVLVYFITDFINALRARFYTFRFMFHSVSVVLWYYSARLCVSDDSEWMGFSIDRTRLYHGSCMLQGFQDPKRTAY